MLRHRDITGGSSPRVRGKRDLLRHARDVARLIPARAGKTGIPPEEQIAGGLIPARAGKTAPQSPTKCATGAHPRACGENPQIPDDLLVGGGSSPRVRGKRQGEQDHRRGGRLIPARAGKTVPGHSVVEALSAHPRACGENALAVSSAVAGSGSSPRVRGKPRASAVIAAHPGLIPARAGKTPRWTWRARFSSAHPRACGENAEGADDQLTMTGSSPRVRGKRGQRPGSRRVRRLIPARAGKTWYPNRPRSIPPAHPRACGENAAASKIGSRVDGSSPRVRGKPDGERAGGDRSRLIPARAGKTVGDDADRQDSGAHPRACGENSAMIFLAMRPMGSSPRVRGKRPWTHRRPLPGGLIPARAGKT